MTDDFGRRLEAAIRDECTKTHVYDHTLWQVYQAVRSANAQVSAPAPERRLSEAQVSLPKATAGAGVDLADAMRSLQFCIQTPGLNISAMLKAAQCRALLSHIESLERDAARYRWLRDTPIWPNSILPRHTGEAWDAAIDAARKEGKP